MSIVREYEMLRANNKLVEMEKDALLDNILKRLIENISTEITVFTDREFVYCVKTLIDKGYTFIKLEKNEEGFRFYQEVNNEELRIEGEFIIG